MRTQAIRLDVSYSFECHACAFADPRYETPTCPSKPRPRNGKACLWRWQLAKPHRRRHDGRLHNRFIEQHLASYASLCTAATSRLQHGIPFAESLHSDKALVGPAFQTCLTQNTEKSSRFFFNFVSDSKFEDTTRTTAEMAHGGVGTQNQWDAEVRASETMRTLKLRSSRGRLVGGMDDGLTLPERAHCTRSLVPKTLLPEAFAPYSSEWSGFLGVTACYAGTEFSVVSVSPCVGGVGSMCEWQEEDARLQEQTTLTLRLSRGCLPGGGIGSSPSAKTGPPSAGPQSSGGRSHVGTPFLQSREGTLENSVLDFRGFEICNKA